MDYALASDWDEAEAGPFNALYGRRMHLSVSSLEGEDGGMDLLSQTIIQVSLAVSDRSRIKYYELNFQRFMAMTRKQYFAITVYHCRRFGIEPRPRNEPPPTRHSAIYNPTIDCSLDIFFKTGATINPYRWKENGNYVNYSVLMKDRDGELINGYYRDEYPFGQHSNRP